MKEHRGNQKCFGLRMLDRMLEDHFLFNKCCYNEPLVNENMDDQ